MQILWKQEDEEDAVRAFHPLGRIQEQGSGTGGYVLLRVVALHRRMRRPGELLREDALRLYHEG
jgi:hypothetical protein